MACGESAEYPALLTTLPELTAWIAGHQQRHYREDPGCGCGWIDDHWSSTTFAQHIATAVIEDLGSMLPSNHPNLSWAQLCEELTDRLRTNEERTERAARRRAVHLSGWFHALTGIIREFSHTISPTDTAALTSMITDGAWEDALTRLCRLLIDAEQAISDAHVTALTAIADRIAPPTNTDSGIHTLINTISQKA
jgi:hypothetical protein